MFVRCIVKTKDRIGILVPAAESEQISLEEVIQALCTIH